MKRMIGSPAAIVSVKCAAVATMLLLSAGHAAAVGGPANDSCADPTPLTLPATISGSTIGATTDVVPFCGTALSTSPGVWYTFTAAATGSVTADTCSNASYDSKIGVFTGSCGALVCVTGNDDACGLRSRVTFATTAGTTYRVLLTGFGGAVGNFTLSIVSDTLTLQQNLACAGTGITALTPPTIVGPAQKNLLLGLLNVATTYQSGPYQSLGLSAVKSAVMRTDGCALRGSPDTVVNQGGAGMDFVTTCGVQAPIYACLNNAQTQLTPP